MKKASKTTQAASPELPSGSESGRANASTSAGRLAHALAMHRQGRVEKAEEGYRRILAENPDHGDALNFLGVLHLDTGRVDDAVTGLERAARIDPENEIVWNNLGNALKAQGRTDRAEACYRRAMAINETDPDPVFNLATLLQGRGRPEAAEAAYRRTLALSPDDAGALNNLASLLCDRGAFADAEAAYRRVLERQPDNPRVLTNLGRLLVARGRHDEAAACCRRALADGAETLEVLLCLGRACREAGRLDEARSVGERAVALHPESAKARFNLGNVHKDAGRFTEAAGHYRSALDRDAALAPAWCNLGLILREEGRNDAAMDCYQKAVAADPAFAEAYNNMSILFTETGRIGEAVAACRKAQGLRDDFAASYNNMARALKYSGRAAESIAWYRRSLGVSPDTAFVHSNLLYCLAYLDGPEGAPRAVSAEHRRWESVHGAPPHRVRRHHANRPDPDRPLRVGYLSPDFRKHPVATFMAPVLSGHNTESVHSVCFSDVRGGDRITETLRSLAGEWIDIAGLDDDRVEALIEQRRIDILVDLAGHTAGNRMPLFTRRPAPVQVSYLGYPNTTGLSAMNYRLTDAWADPPGMTETYHSETLVRLPQGFLCYAPPEDTAAVAPSPMTEQGGITFGSFNNLAKFNDSVAALWARILHAVPRSRLVMKFRTLNDPTVRGHVLARFAAHGIGADRIQCLGFLPSARDHFALYHRIDIALDTFPYNGTTTTCEALWMGVPVVALAGETHAARVGVSILTGLGLDFLVARSPDDYAARAAALAADPQRLQTLRSKLRPLMAASPLTDGPGFARRLEAAYRGMWRRWCASKAGAH